MNLADVEWNYQIGDLVCLRAMPALHGTVDELVLHLCKDSYYQNLKVHIFDTRPGKITMGHIVEMDQVHFRLLTDEERGGK